MLRGLLLLLLLSGCALVRESALLAPGSLGQSLQVSQLVVLQQPAGELRFSVVWSQHQQQFTLAGLSLAGQLLFRLQQRADQLAIERFVPAIPAAQVRELAQQIQWAYWPAQAVRSALPTGWHLAVGADAGRPWRRFYRRDRLMLEFLYAAPEPFASLQLTRAQGPGLRVQTLSVQALPVEPAAVAPTPALAPPANDRVHQSFVRELGKA